MKSQASSLLCNCRCTCITARTSRLRTRSSLHKASFATTAADRETSTSRSPPQPATQSSTANPSLNGRKFRMAVVGSGPAGFYAASRVLSSEGSENAQIDMYEELPVPFGLVRYGVAPDHPEVKVSYGCGEANVDRQVLFRI